MARIGLRFRTQQLSAPRFGDEPVAVIRVLARVRLRSTSGADSVAWRAIVDTGAPFGVLPRRVWRDLKVAVREPDSPIGGISRRKACRVPAAFGTVQGRLEDTQGDVSRWYDFPVFLAKTNCVPLILGFADLLESLKLTVDYPAGEAWVEERDS